MFIVIDKYIFEILHVFICELYRNSAFHGCEDIF